MSARSIFKLTFGLSLCFFLFHASPAFGQETFYIDNGKGIQKVEKGDPSKLKVTEWQVRLFKKGKPTTGNDNWGLITGKSSAIVMAKLKKAQDFELRYNAWAGKGRVPDDVLTHFNSLGPIAVVEKDAAVRERENEKKRSIPKDVWDKIQNVLETAKLFYEGYQHIIEITSADPTAKTPFDNVGNVFKEYVDNLRDVFERVADLRMKLEAGIAPSMEEIKGLIDGIVRSFDVAGNSGTRVSTGLGLKENEIVPPSVAARPATPAPPASTPPSAPPTTAPVQADNATERRLEELASQLSSSFENVDPENPEAVFQRVNDIARQMIRIIESDPTADANLKELARLLLSITETTDPEELSGKFERMGQLLEQMSQ